MTQRCLIEASILSVKDLAKNQRVPDGTMHVMKVVIFQGLACANTQ